MNSVRAIRPMEAQLPEGMLEKQLSQIWRNRWLDTHDLATESGERVEIIHPGRPNDNRGPDFCGATFVLDGRVVRGDIELHVDSSDWTAHGHHLDSACNRVVMHVVMRHDARTPTVRQDGREVPVLVVRRHLQAPTTAWWSAACLPERTYAPCRNAPERLTEHGIAALLESAGDSRFLSKADRFENEMIHTDAEQVLFEGTMTALGYAKNKAPFLELSHRLPIRVLESLLEALGDMPEQQSCLHLMDLMISVAGLAQGGRHTSPGRRSSMELEGVMAAGYQVEVMSPYQWDLFRVRPNNSPLLRLGAMSHLLLRYRRDGLLRGMLGMVADSPPYNASSLLRTKLTVAGLGPDRADDIIINVLLPFAFAYWRHAGCQELSCRSLALYHAHGRVAVNCMERHMVSQLGLDHRLVNSARRQQGLIHIYNAMCGAGKCRACLLGQLEAGDHVKVQAICPTDNKPEIARSRDHGRIIGAQAGRRNGNRHRRGISDTLAETGI